MSFVKITDMKWEATDENGGSWWASNVGYKFVWVYDSGAGNSNEAGCGELLARHFFKQKYQLRFKKIFGHEQFQEINQCLKAEYELFLENPKAYNKLN